MIFNMILKLNILFKIPSCQTPKKFVKLVLNLCVRFDLRWIKIANQRAQLWHESPRTSDSAVLFPKEVSPPVGEEKGGQLSQQWVRVISIYVIPGSNTVDFVVVVGVDIWPDTGIPVKREYTRAHQDTCAYARWSRYLPQLGAISGQVASKEDGLVKFICNRWCYVTGLNFWVFSKYCTESLTKRTIIVSSHCHV